jgi:hypothetical protein
LKISPAQLRTPLVGKNGVVDGIWSKWLQEVGDSKMREFTSETAVTMKTGEFIVQKTASTTYLVYYDGTHRYYWQIAGTDLL